VTDEVFDVVLVDDAADVRAVVQRQLHLSGRFRVMAEGATGREAVELAAAHRPAALVLDASMPDMDGLDAIAGIRAASPTTKIVMLSGFDAASLRGEALRRGAADYVEKSAPLKELPARLLSVLGAHFDVAAVDDQSLGAEAEAVLAAHLERFRTFFDQAAIGMATLTLAGALVRANEALVDLLGERPEALVGNPLVTFVAEDDNDAVLAALREAAGSPHAREVEHRLRADGQDRWVHTTIAAVRDADDRPLYLFAQLEDVTARHEALEQLRASEERFRLMVESVQDYAIFMLDRTGHVSTWNLGAKRLKGYDAEEIIGKHFRTFYPDEARSIGHPERELELAVRDGRYEEEGWRVRKDGSLFWANVVITALFDHAGDHLGFAKVTRDMTERRHAETARDRAAADLAASNEELHEAAQQTEEFLAVTAHELQSPVAAIIGAAEILVDYWDKLDSDERVDTLRRISAGGTRIRRLLDDLLTASRLEAGTFAVTSDVVALEPLVDQACSEVVHGSGEVAVTGVKGLRVRADAARVVQIVINLLTNAAKYGQPPLSIDAQERDGFVELRVSDGGPGVPDTLEPRLFEKFAKHSQTTGRGTGLGLYIVRELARAQGGAAWYEPPSTFVVSLPAAV
jgi:PAS domain S-box-containing protein